MPDSIQSFRFIKAGSEGFIGLKNRMATIKLEKQEDHL